MIPSSGQNGLSRFESFSTPLAAPHLRAERLAAPAAPRSVVLSSRSPWYDGARSRPSCVHSANSTSQTSFGSTQTMSALRTFGSFGASANGVVGRSSGRSSPSSRSISASAEAGADVARVAQPARPRRPPRSERAEAAGPVSLALRVAGDHELLAAVGLDLEPGTGAPPWLVDGVRPLGDDPLEPLRLRRREERLAVVEHVRDLDAAPPEVDELPRAARAARRSGSSRSGSPSTSSTSKAT